ncbi:MAG: hypothetical protein A2542_04160, partial [Parcubacteria group bacterium RIFOXYD2_FULL_52_8]
MSRTIDLQPLGLTVKEGKVYVALLELGSATALEISKKSGIPKSSVHDTVGMLVRKSLVSSYAKKNRKIFSAAPPQTFVERMKSEEAHLREVLPQLVAINNARSNKPKVRFYDDKIGIETAAQEFIKEADELYSFGNVDAAFRGFPEFFPKFTKERIATKIIVRALASDGPVAREFKKEDPRSLRRTKIVLDAEAVSPTAWMWNDKIAIFNTRGLASTVILEDREVVELFKAFFQLI